MPEYYIGIDFGGTKILAGLVDKSTGHILYSSKKKTKKENGIEAVLERINLCIADILENSTIPMTEIQAICIGVPGQIDPSCGKIIAAPNLNCININIKDIIEQKYSIPVCIGNDVNVATLGEAKFGAGVGYKDFVCVFVGTGVGSGIVKDGKIHNGATGTAGEIGHIVVDFGGRPCGCGANGCLEAYASRTAIEKRIIGSLQKGKYSAISALITDGKTIKSNMIKKALLCNDELVTQTLDEAAKYLGSGLASVINFYNPELIILGGGLIDKIDYFYNATVKYATEWALPTPAKHIIFKKAMLGDYSGVIGATLLETTPSVCLAE